MAQRMLRTWAEKELVPLVPAMERGDVLPYDAMRHLIRSFGIDEMARATFAKATPGGDTNAGGERGFFGGDPALSAIVAIELSRVCPGFALAFGASLGLAGGAILAKGTAAQKKRFALPILTGEKIGAWAMTEPGAGSDAFRSMRTIARRSGDGYILNGQKTFITNAPFADVLVIYAKLAEPGQSENERPIHAFIVEKGAPGLSLSKPMEKMGMHSSPTGEIFLSDVCVAKSALLGETETLPARDRAREVFHGERTGMVPMCFGVIDRCLELSVAYAKERQTWGKQIGEYQLVQEKLARMYMHRENVRNLLFKQLEKAHKKVTISAAEASASKLYCARVATECALEAVQIFGGNGYMREFTVEMMARDAKLFQIGGGTDEIQITAIARQLLSE